MKHSISLFLFFLCISLVYAQEKPNFRPTFYKDTVSGKLYWNKSLPAYLTISPTPDPSKGVQLESHATKQYADPFYFDTEGINYVRTRWAVDKKTKRAMPDVEIVWEVYADSRPSQTRLHLIDQNKHTVGGKLFCSGQVKMIFKAEDALSGVKDIYFSINESDYKLYSDTISFNHSGEYSVKYFSVDNVNNVERTHGFNFIIDFIPPSTRAVITGVKLGRENIISINSNIFLEAHDSLSGVKQIYYRFDSSGWRVYQPHTKLPFAGLSDGEHNLQFYAVDNVNNKEQVQTFTFYLDKTAPIIIADVLGDKFIVNGKVFFSGRTKLKLTSVDNKAGVKDVFYSIDGGEFKKYTGPFYLPSTPGWHDVTYFAIDSTENVTKDKLSNRYYNYRMKVDKVYMDLTGPKLSYVISGDQYKRSDTVFVSSRTKIIVSAQDLESGVKSISYYFDNEPTERNYTGPFTLDAQKPGLHKVNIVGYDNVNNRNIRSFLLFLDKQPPKIFYSFDIETLGQKDSLSVYAPNTKLFLSFVDDYTGTSKIYYSVNGSKKLSYHNYITGFKKGINKVTVEVWDKVGNKATEIIRFYVR